LFYLTSVKCCGEAGFNEVDMMKLGFSKVGFQAVSEVVDPWSGTLGHIAS
jgi:hypothetical protein